MVAEEISFEVQGHVLAKGNLRRKSFNTEYGSRQDSRCQVCTVILANLQIKPSFSGTIILLSGISMGKVAKGQQCSVVGCGAAAVRSISPDKVAHSGINIGNARRAYLCKAHYREFKKLTRKDRQLDKWRFSA